MRLELLKKKKEENEKKRGCKRNENRERDNALDIRKRSQERNEFKPNGKSIIVKNYNTEVWHARATKALDSEIERKRHKDND